MERVVLNALALDTALLPDSCDEYRRYRKWNCAFGDYLNIAFRRSRSTLRATAALQLRSRDSMGISQTVVQLSCSQCANKCRVVLELVSKGVPNHRWFRVVLRDFRNQSVKRVIDSAALVMHDVIIAPNEDESNDDERQTNHDVGLTRSRRMFVKDHEHFFV